MRKPCVAQGSADASRRTLQRIAEEASVWSAVRYRLLSNISHLMWNFTVNIRRPCARETNECYLRELANDWCSTTDLI